MDCDREDDVGGRVLSFAFSGSAYSPNSPHLHTLVPATYQPPPYFCFCPSHSPFTSLDPFLSSQHPLPCRLLSITQLSVAFSTQLMTRRQPRVLAVRFPADGKSHSMQQTCF
ncbi:uncharacterized protein AKAW2_11932A [Aspergillus luchuensis]|uniref:Uncharacterized protein n=1 Tax=Aspergillus kawachii TaxID=1069201 RepID=A0A7R8A814_ASPKA|nr:uncharacterized protein AKAW2_11932A [Aspergillus luchuensis]BCR94886.1 hypothetical protein AKAW2_11932A [Aspergillus luchuensis]BCS07463.1 hypothetical protein ALUC_11844A [Aspergillus luchuensis]